MTRNGIAPEAQEQIIDSITSFALYGFPESHSASFALLAYASAYLKTHYLGAFTAALLNHQPMGFYHPSTIVKDAQRHGLKVKAVDVTRSEWGCTVEKSTVDGLRSMAVDCRPSTVDHAVRLGLRYVRGLREEAARALVRQRQQRPFESITDMARRVPELRRTELETLAAIGALNSIGEGSQPRRHPSAALGAGSDTENLVIGRSGDREIESIADCRLPIVDCEKLDSLAPEEIVNGRSGDREIEKPAKITGSPDPPIPRFHRRDALWQVASASRGEGPLLRGVPEPDMASPLEAMDREERLVADFRGTGVTVGPHPMAYRRAELKAQGICSAAELEQVPNGQWVRAAGCVIARQRPGTARGFLFLSLEDETGIANAIVTPDLFEQNRLLLVGEKFLLIEGVLQNLDNVISVKAERVQPLPVTEAETRSHDFH